MRLTVHLSVLADDDRIQPTILGLLKGQLPPWQSTPYKIAVKRYALVNSPEVRSAVVLQAAQRYGYSTKQVDLRLYVGRFAERAKGDHEARIRAWAKTQRVGSGTIGIVDLSEVVDNVVEVARSTQYINDPVLVLEVPGVGHLSVIFAQITADAILEWADEHTIMS